MHSCWHLLFIVAEPCWNLLFIPASRALALGAFFPLRAAILLSNKFSLVAEARACFDCLQRSLNRIKEIMIYGYYTTETMSGWETRKEIKFKGSTALRQEYLGLSYARCILSDKQPDQKKSFQRRFAWCSLSLSFQLLIRFIMSTSWDGGFLTTTSPALT